VTTNPERPEMTPERLRAVMEAIHKARFTRVGREPLPMDVSDADYCMALARAAIVAMEVNQ
jgi:hypothetical protein